MDSDIPCRNGDLRSRSAKGDLLSFTVRVLLVAVVFSVFVSHAAATDFYIEGKADNEIFESGDQVRYVAESSERANFTVNITQTGMELARFELIFQEQFQSNNDTFYRYTSPYRMNKSEFGIQTAYLWANRSTEEMNVTTWSISSAGNLSYRVTNDQPNIISLRDYPSLKFTESSIYVEAEIADSEEDVHSATVDIDGRTIQMNQTASRDNFQEFLANFTINRTGSYDYTVNIQDNGSLESSASGSFYVEQAPESEDTNVNLTVNDACYNVTSMLSAPGNEPLNWIRKNTTGAFLGRFYNSGTLPHNTTVSLDITDEGNNSWDPGEEIGPVIVSYLPKELNISAYGKGEYYRQFLAGYDAGNYTGRMHVDSRCVDSRDNITKNYNFTITDNFQIVETEGEDSFLTNGSQTVNQSIPADSTRRGAESDQTLEGDNQEPGSTVQPQPQPRPALSLNMETVNLSYSSPRGRYKEVGLNITNHHPNASFQGVQLVPQIEDLEGEWDSRTASITSISPSQDITRNIFLRPGPEVQPGKYRIPVLARLPGGRALDVEYVNFHVTEEEVTTSGLSIVEVPRNFPIERNSTSVVPVLVKNTGQKELNNISLGIQNLEECGSMSVDPISSLSVNETDTLEVELDSGTEITECQTLFVLSAESGAYSFANVNISVTAVEGFIPAEFRVPLIAFIWTLVLVLYALLSRRYGLDSLLVKFPFLLLILGESVIVLYLAANYYGILPKGLLPF